MTAGAMEELEQRLNKIEGEVQELPGGLDAIRTAIEGEGAAQTEARQETQGATAEKRRNEGPTASLHP